MIDGRVVEDDKNLLVIDERLVADDKSLLVIDETELEIETAIVELALTYGCLIDQNSRISWRLGVLAVQNPARDHPPPSSADRP